MKDPEAERFRLLLRSLDLERSKLGHRLHDTVAQNLAALSMTLSMLEKHGANGTELVADSLQLVDQCIRQVRIVSYYLHPPMIEELGLKPALLTMTSVFAEMFGTRIDVAADDRVWCRFAPANESATYRMINDSAVSLSSAGARSISVELSRTTTELGVRISGAVALHGHAKDLLISLLQERSAPCKGDARLRSRNGETAVNLHIPLEVRR